MIRIIAIGKKTEYEIKINDYIKRLKKPFNIEFKLLDYSSESGNAAREKESKEILKLVNKKDYVILLDERGKEIDNMELTQKLIKNSDVTFIIGGPYGVTQELRDRSNFV
jgi:23S rRNA (pseudouridine1915-N3)-methyltransferase